MYFHNQMDLVIIIILSLLPPRRHPPPLPGLLVLVPLSWSSFSSSLSSHPIMVPSCCPPSHPPPQLLPHFHPMSSCSWQRLGVPWWWWWFPFIVIPVPLLWLFVVTAVSTHGPSCEQWARRTNPMSNFPPLNQLIQMQLFASINS